MGAQTTSSFAGRHFATGAILWLCCLQFFVVERLGILTWQGDYSLRHNVISDLGATICITSGAHPFCSPLHLLMNASFVLQGLLIAGGAALMWRARPLRMGPGLLLAGLSAPGIILVGLFPENTVHALHYAGAAENFALLTLSAFAFAPAFARAGAPLRACLSIVVALMGTTGMILLARHQYMGLGEGWVERFTAYPLPLYLAALGAGFLRDARRNETIPVSRP